MMPYLLYRISQQQIAQTVSSYTAYNIALP